MLARDEAVLECHCRWSDETEEHASELRLWAVLHGCCAEPAAEHSTQQSVPAFRLCIDTSLDVILVVNDD